MKWQNLIFDAAMILIVMAIAFWAGGIRYRKALRRIIETDVPPDDAKGRVLQDTIYHVKGIAEAALAKSSKILLILSKKINLR